MSVVLSFQSGDRSSHRQQGNQQNYSDDNKAAQVIKQLADMDKRIDAVVNLKVTDQTPNIKN